jgi:hypothetical protein
MRPTFPIVNFKSYYLSLLLVPPKEEFSLMMSHSSPSTEEELRELRV